MCIDELHLQVKWPTSPKLTCYQNIVGISYINS